MSILTVGEISNLCSFIILIRHIRKTKNCSGISCKTQEIFLIAYLSRYIDIFFTFYSTYNFCMKLLFTWLTFYLIYLIRFSSTIKESYEASKDFFNYWLYLVPPSLLLGGIVASDNTLTEFLWNFSQFFESVALVPWVIMIKDAEEEENINTGYIFTLGIHKLLYLIYQIIRKPFEGIEIVKIKGVIEFYLFAMLLYHFIKKKYMPKNSVTIPI